MLLKLKKVEVEGFRAFAKKVAVEVGDQLTLIVGPPGSGKTSLIRAIEFALFGATREIPSRIMRKEDLINDECDEAKVKLVLSDGRTEIVVIRTLNRQGKSSLTVIANGNEFRDELAEQYLSSKIECSLDEFAREFSIGFQELHALLYSPPAEQSRMIDALIGISDLEELYREVSSREVKSKLEELRDEERKLGGEAIIQEFERIKDQYTKVVKRRDGLISEIDRLEARKRILEDEYRVLQASSEEIEILRKEAENLKEILKRFEKEKVIKSYNIDRNYIIEKMIDLRNRLCELLEDCFLGQDVEYLRKFDISFDNINDFISKSRELLGKINNECLVKISYEYQNVKNQMFHISEYVNRIEEELGEIEFEIEKRDEARIEYEQLVKTHGDIATVTKRIAQLEVELRARQMEEGRARCAHVLQEGVIESLKSSGVAQCPVCGRKIENAAELPRLEFSESYSLKREKIEKDLATLKEIERKLRVLDLELKLLEDYEEKRKELEEELEQLLDELNELKATFDDIEERINKLRNNVIQLSKELDHIEALYKGLQYFEALEKLRKIENKLTSLGYNEEKINKLINEINKVQQDLLIKKSLLSEVERQEIDLIKKLKEYEFRSKSIKDLKNKESRLLQLVDLLDDIKRALANSRLILRQRIVKRLSSEVTNIFSSINPSLDYDTVHIDVEGSTSEGTKGRYAIFVRRRSDGRLVSALTRLSDGQKSLLALSLFIASRRLKPRKLSLLLLDDPAPNLDEETKVILSQTLIKLSDTLQVILTTQSELVARKLQRIAHVVDLCAFSAANLKTEQQ